VGPPLSDERTDLSFTIPAGLASRVILGSESRGTHDYILLSQISRLAQPGGTGPRIYILPEQGGPVKSLGLLLLAGIRTRFHTGF
jgi:hypothetical protein